MQICSNCKTSSPDSALKCPNCDADLSEWSNSAVALARMRSNPRVTYIRIAVSDDCCPACRVQEGAYAKDSVPALPTRACSHNLGCRCFYQPVLEELFP